MDIPLRMHASYYRALKAIADRHSLHLHEENSNGTWIVCQSLLQPAGRDAHAGDTPPKAAEDFQWIQSLRQLPGVKAQIFYQARLACTSWLVQPKEAFSRERRC